MLRAAAIQLSCTPGEREKNLHRAGGLLTKAAQQGVRWAVLPELFSTGYHVEGRDAELAERLDGGPTTDWMRSMAARHGMFITGTIIEAAPDGCADTTVTVSPLGELMGSYRKCRLWGPERERFMAGGSIYATIELEDGWTAGTQICYEVGFPEGARAAALSGAQVIAFGAAFGLARSYAWELAVRARALENGCYVVAAGHWGSEGAQYPPFAGKSCVISPRGTVLAQADEGDGLAIADLNMDEVELRRREIPYLRDFTSAPVIDAFNNISR